MAKKGKNVTEGEVQRQSRKEVLRTRKHQQQMRQIRLGVGIVLGLLVLIFVVAIVNEYFVAPNRAVARVGDTTITLQEWQDRVRFERAQRIILLENQLEAFGGDVGIVQQFGQQAIFDLVEAETLGQTVLNNMIDEAVIVDEAQKRGITVTDEDVTESIQESFGYFGGESPTPVPTPTETVMPTPSITPIPTEVITDVVPTNTPFPTPTLGPTNTPQPTPTPVSAEAFAEDFNDIIGQFEDLGISEAQYREVIRKQLYRQRLADTLAEEQDLPTEAEQVSYYFIQYDTEEAANEGLALVQEQGFLETWNQIRSQPPSAESPATAVASEVLWRTQDAIETAQGTAVAAAAFNLPINEASDVLVNEVDAETQNYYLIMVSGREVRPLSQSAIEQEKQQAVTNLVDQQLTGTLEITDFSNGRVPRQPILDPIFTTPPTATPIVSTLEPVQPAPTTESSDGGN